MHAKASKAAKATRGRPKKNAADRTTSVITVKFTPERKRQIQAAADSDRRSQADWVRMVIEDHLDQINRESGEL